MKKYRVFIIFALILLLLVLFRGLIGNIIRYKSGTITELIGLNAAIDRIRLETPDGSRHLDEAEQKQFLNMLKTQTAHTPIFQADIEFPDAEYLIYTLGSPDHPQIRLRMTDEAIEVYDFFRSPSYKEPAPEIQIYLLDN